jgi:hypothetical protein
MSRRFIYDKYGDSFEVPQDYKPYVGAAATVRGDVPGYLSHATGKWVEGAVQRREDLAVSGCRPFEGQASEERERLRNVQYNQESRDRNVERQLQTIVPHMPQHVKRLFQ